MLSRRKGPHPLVSYALALGVSGPAFALEPIRPTEPRIFADSSIDVVQVADSFDGPDMFDLNLSLTFQHSERFAPIRRETTINQPGLATGGFIADSLVVGTYHSTTERLLPEVSIGLLPDLALTVGLPVILAYDQQINDGGGGSSEATRGLAGEQLFQVPFTSPTRSGIEALTIALDLGLMNQWRKPHEPNWTIGVIGRFNVSEPMHACNPNAGAGQVACAHPSDRNRNGVADALGPGFDDIQDEPEGSFTGSRSPGVSRGTTMLEAHAYVSKRTGYIEPYSGVSAAFEFASPGSDFGLTDLESSLVNHPPLRGTLIVGLGVVPWEQPEKHRRLALDFRATGTYVSEGRDYSELFDALGSSTAGSLRDPQFAGYTANIQNGSLDPFTPSVVDTSSTRVSFTGLTTVQQHGDYTLSTRFTWQAGEYVNFDLGAEWRIIQAHLLTGDQACSPAITSDATESGPCKYVAGYDGNDEPVWQSTGKSNPNYRRTISEPGHRYRSDTSHGLRAWISARVMF